MTHVKTLCQQKMYSNSLTFNQVALLETSTTRLECTQEIINTALKRAKTIFKQCPALQDDPKFKKLFKLSEQGGVK